MTTDLKTIAATEAQRQKWAKALNDAQSDSDEIDQMLAYITAGKRVVRYTVNGAPTNGAAAECSIWLEGEQSPLLFATKTKDLFIRKVAASLTIPAPAGLGFVGETLHAAIYAAKLRLDKRIEIVLAQGVTAGYITQ